MQLGRGFTLIELMVVMALMGLFTALVMLAGRSVAEGATESASINVLKQAVEIAQIRARSSGIPHRLVSLDEGLNVEQTFFGNAMGIGGSQDGVAHFELPGRARYGLPDQALSERTVLLSIDSGGWFDDRIVMLDSEGRRSRITVSALDGIHVKWEGQE